MRNIIDFNDGWLFEGRDRVRLPHNAVDLPFNYFDEKVYQRPFTYEKTFTFDPAWTGREVTVHFEGAMANAEVRLDGQLIARHADGYTPFTARLSDCTPGEHVLTVTIDGSENPATPESTARFDLRSRPRFTSETSKSKLQMYFALLAPRRGFGLPT